MSQVDYGPTETHAHTHGPGHRPLAAVSDAQGHEPGADVEGETAASRPSGGRRGSAFARLALVRRETRIGLAAFLSFSVLVGVFIADRLAKSKAASAKKEGVVAGTLLAVRPPKEPVPTVVSLKDAPHPSPPSSETIDAVAASKNEEILPPPSRGGSPDPAAILVANNTPTTPPVSPVAEPTPPAARTDPIKPPDDDKAKLEPPGSAPNAGAKSDPPTVQPLEPPQTEPMPAELPKPLDPIAPASASTPEKSKAIEPTPTTPPSSGLLDLPPSNVGNSATPGARPIPPDRADPTQPIASLLPRTPSPSAEPKPELVLPKPAETPTKPEPTGLPPLAGADAPPPSTTLIEPTALANPASPVADPSSGGVAPSAPPRVEPTRSPFPTQPPAPVEPTPSPFPTQPPAAVTPTANPAPTRPPAPVSPTPTQTPSPFDPPATPAKSVESVPRSLPILTDDPASAAMPSTTAAAMPTAAPSLVKTLGPGWTSLRNLGKTRIIEDDDLEKPSPKPEIPDAPPPRDELEADDDLEPVLHGVERNENFWTISRLYYGSGRYYKALWSYNRREVPDIRRLYVGTTIKVPPPKFLDGSLVESTTAPSARSPIAAAAPKAKAIGPSNSTDAEVRTVPISRSKGGIDSDLSVGNPVSRTKVEDVDAPIRPTYRVRPYDTLRGIAKQTLGDARRDREILELNKDVIVDPRRLTTGQSLVLPEDATVATKVR